MDTSINHCFHKHKNIRWTCSRQSCSHVKIIFLIKKYFIS